jgi:rhodanese-related sulfurtransferase
MTKNSKNSPKSLPIQDFIAAMQKENALIIDTRLPDYFELGHIISSLNICNNKAYEGIIQNITPLNKPVLILCKAKEEEESYKNLTKLGFSNILGYLEGSIEAWIGQNQKFDMVISISSEELALDSKHNPTAIIIDVRTKEEFDVLHVFNAVNIPLENLTEELAKLNKTQETLTYSNTGYTSMLASSLLKKNGFSNVKNVWGGFERIREETVDLVGSK